MLVTSLLDNPVAQGVPGTYKLYQQAEVSQCLVVAIDIKPLFLKDMDFLTIKTSSTI